MGAPVTTRLAQFAADTDYQALPEDVIAHTKLAILDTLGVALAGSALGEGCEGVLAYAAAQSGSGPARVWASGRSMSTGLAAFCNAAHARCLDYDDIIENPQIHVAVCIVPAAFAMAESQGGPVSGRRLLAATAIGSEIQSRLGAAIARTQDASSFPVMLSTQVFGYFAAAATAGHLLGLDARRMESALGLAMMQAAGTEEMVVHAPESVGKCIYAGFSNQGGIQAALMAANNVPALGCALEGQAGLFEAYYGGRFNGEALTGWLGQRYEATRRCFKSQPGTLVSHAFAEAALIVMRREGLTPADIFETRLRVGGWGRAMCEPIDIRRNPPTAAAAMNSIPFIVAKAIVNGKVSLTDFQASGREQVASREMAERVRCFHDSSLDNPLGLEPGLIEIVTMDGRVFAQRVDKPRGHPSRPLSFDDMARKFRDNAGYAVSPLTPARLDQVIDQVAHLDRSPDVRILLDLIAPPATTGALQ
jgi:2-methylcitrate dehydratase PrpD